MLKPDNPLFSARNLAKPRRMLFSFIACLVLLLALMMTGCGSQEGQSQSSTPSSASTPATPAKDAIKIEQLNYSVNNTVEDGHRRVALEFVNNSSYEIAECRFDFALNSGVTDEEITEAFSSMDAVSDKSQIVTAIRQYGIHAEFDYATNAGATSPSEPLLLGVYYLTDMSQYELTTLDMVTISYIDDGKMYKETYDAVNDSYSLDSDVVDISQWSDGELASIVPQPENVYITDVREYNNQFSFDATNVTQEEYNAYVAAAKAAGFDSDVTSGDSFYYAHSADGKYDFNIFYYPDSQTMNLIMNVESE